VSRAGTIFKVVASLLVVLATTAADASTHGYSLRYAGRYCSDTTYPGAFVALTPKDKLYDADFTQQCVNICMDAASKAATKPLILSSAFVVQTLKSDPTKHICACSSGKCLSSETDNSAWRYNSYTIDALAAPEQASARPPRAPRAPRPADPNPGRPAGTTRPARPARPDRPNA
jgi:hypothetical protein